MRDRGASVERTSNARVLRKITETAFAIDHTRLRFVGATEHLEKCRLACAIATDKTDLVAGHYRERSAVDDEFAANFDAQIFDLKHPSRLAPHSH